MSGGPEEGVAIKGMEILRRQLPEADNVTDCADRSGLTRVAPRYRAEVDDLVIRRNEADTLVLRNDLHRGV